MKIEITHTPKKGVQVELLKVPKRMDGTEIAAVLEEVIKELQSMQLSLLPNNDHL